MNMMNIDLDEEIRQAQQERNAAKMIAFDASSSVMDEDLLGQSKSKKFEGYSTSIAAGGFEDEEDDEGTGENASGWSKAASSWNAHKKFLEDPELMKGVEQDVFKPYRAKKVSEREDEYRARWRKRALSPDRIDPFSAAAKKKQATSALSTDNAQEGSNASASDDKSKKRTYQEIILEAQLEKQKADTLFKLKRQKMEEEREAKLKAQQEAEERENKKKEQRDKKNGKDIKASSSKDKQADRWENDKYENRERGRGSGARGRGNDSDSERGQAKGKGRDSRDRRGKDDKEKEDKYKWGKQDEEEEDNDKPAVFKEKPSFALSGKLSESTNTYKGVVLKWTEPTDMKQPTKRWRLYAFKNNQPFGDPFQLHRMPAYLFGRERKVVDIPTDHPSCSGQHAVICFRLVHKEDDFGVQHKLVRPYLMDLGSTNGTKINDESVEAERYYELKEFDKITFGNSSREYVLLHEQSKGVVQEGQDD